MTDLEALAKLASEATPGEWAADGCRIFLGVTHRPDLADERDMWEYNGRIYDEGGHTEADAAYIAAASPDVVLVLVRLAIAARDHRDGPLEDCIPFMSALADLNG